MTKKTHDADVEFIRALAEILSENELTDLRVKRSYPDDGSLDVRVSRGVETPQVTWAPPPASQPPQQQPQAAASSGGPRNEPAQTPASDDPAAHPGAVTSPMVGTVYLSPEPGAEAYVKTGDRVTEGQTLLIVEAMKTMNQIPSPRAGTVKRILVEDGAPVEFGAPLMIVE